ncbi:MAG: FtsX-like permease family protein [Opitutae bacterium]|nr:FtsX-like permease family protein [Opitutae bacterium]
MTSNILVALRFLTANKRPMAMSLAGIVFGVGFFIFSQAQTSGFEQFFIKTVLGTNGAIRVQDRIRATFSTMEMEEEKGNGGQGWVIENKENLKYIEGIEHPLEVIAAIKQFDSVTGVSEVLAGTVIVSNNFRSRSGTIYGVDIDRHAAVSDLENQIIFGDMESIRTKSNGILIGSAFARWIQAKIGDFLLVTAKDVNRRFTVAGIFETGVSDIDRERIYAHLSEARSVLQRPHGASFLQVNLKNPLRAREEAEHMMNTIYYHVASWQERERSWLDAFMVLRVSTALTVSTIILLSGLGMFNTLAMLVMEKTREIAILRSMGYTRKDISSIFLWQGGLVLLAGTVSGWALAVFITFGVSQLPFRVTGIFTTDSFVVHWSIWHYVLATLTAAVVVMAASFLPARRAARLEPGEVIRGTAS